MLVADGQPKVKVPRFTVRFRVKKSKPRHWRKLPKQKIIYTVSCEYRVEPVKSKSFKKMSYYRTKEFKKKFDESFKSDSGEVGGGFKLFSASAEFSQARNRVSDTTTENEKERSEELETNVEFFDGHCQIYRVVEETMIIDGESTTKTTKVLENGTDKLPTEEEKFQWAVRERSKTCGSYHKLHIFLIKSFC